MNQVICFGMLILLLAGCATPERRIQRNPVEFASLSPEHQELVREGKITMGLPSAGVRLALGNPRRVFTRYSDKGVTHIWSYGRTVSSRDQKWVTVTSPDGQRHRVSVDEHTEREVETLRVEFREGVVVAFERLHR